jgi:hypothetical protein
LGFVAEAQMTTAVPSRRKLLIGCLLFFGLAGCSVFNSPGRVAYARWSGHDRYAIDLQRGFIRPVARGDVTVFKQGAPQEWNRVRDPATVQRLVDDFNGNPDRWREVSPYEEHRLWTPPPEPPLM